ncbi:MAG TPA: flagellar motor protein MotB [Burkholderiales bacterium]|nr:flagellar motor protein MotB [Burkholderiales bacterium]
MSGANAREGLQPIIVKRIKKVAPAHHGGAWKIAYADFVTAMMAFFLLMWLLGSTTKGDLQGIAEYFRTPLKVALSGGSGSGDSSSIVQGGGQDLTRTFGQKKQGDIGETKTINLQAAKAEVARQEAVRLKQLQKRVELALDNNPRMTPFRKQIKLDITSEGLRIQIIDDQNRPMFDSGRADVKDWMREILRELGGMLNDVENKVSLSGHTDAAPYSSGDRGYSNWELSADRANASRRELVAGGIADQKIVRVVGLASSIPFDHSDVLNPANRRISIVVLNKQTEEAILKEGSGVEVHDAEEANSIAKVVSAPELPPITLTPTNQ